MRASTCAYSGAFGADGLALYENCVRFRRTHNQTTGFLSLETWRDMLGVDEGQQQDYRDFKRRVLTQAIQEVNEFSDIRVTVEYQRAGRQVIGLKFDVEDHAPLPFRFEVPGAELDADSTGEGAPELRTRPNGTERSGPKGASPETPKARSEARSGRREEASKPSARQPGGRSGREAEAGALVEGASGGGEALFRRLLLFGLSEMQAQALLAKQDAEYVRGNLAYIEAQVEAGHRIRNLGAYTLKAMSVDFRPQEATLRQEVRARRAESIQRQQARERERVHREEEALEQRHRERAELDGFFRGLPLEDQEEVREQVVNLLNENAYLYGEYVKVQRAGLPVSGMTVLVRSTYHMNFYELLVQRRKGKG